MITVVGGKIGGGKSLYCLDVIEQGVRAGRLVYTNIRLTDRCWFQPYVIFMDDEKYPVVRGEPGCRACQDKKVDKFGQTCPTCKGTGNENFLAFWMYVAPGSLVVIDEADIHFWCRENSKFGRAFFEFNKQSRKLGLDIVYVTQRISNLTHSARAMAQRFIICEWTRRSSRLWAKLPINWSHFKRAEFGAEDCAVEDLQAMAAVKFPDVVHKFGWYESEQIVGDLTFCRPEVLENGDADTGGCGESAAIEGSEELRGQADSVGVDEPVVHPVLVGGRSGWVQRLLRVRALAFARGKHPQVDSGDGGGGGAVNAAGPVA